MPSSRGFSQSRYPTCTSSVSCIARYVLYHTWAPPRKPHTYMCVCVCVCVCVCTQYVNPSPGGSDGKESSCNAGDLGLIPGLGRSPGVGYGNPLQYSCLENPWTEEHDGL